MEESAQYAENVWADRSRSLKNVPPVTRFAWDSDPAVIQSSTIRTEAAFSPTGAGIFGFIVDSIYRIRFHQLLSWYFWRLVGGEMCFAIVIFILMRAKDYFDNSSVFEELVSISSRHATMFDMQSARYQ